MLYYINKIFSYHKVQAFILTLLAACTAIMLITYNSNDPSFNLSIQKYPSNLLGYFGSYGADLFYQFFGLASFIFPICCFVWSLNIYRGTVPKYLFIRIIAMVFTMITFAISFSQITIKSLPSGGAIGIIMLPFVKQLGERGYIIITISAFIFFILSVGVRFSVFWYLIVKLYEFLLYLFLHIIKIKFTKPFFFKKSLSVNHNEVVEVQKIEKNQFIKKSDQAKLNFFNPRSLMQNDDKRSIVLPAIELLRQQSSSQNVKTETAIDLKQTAQQLLSVLGDFGVKGQIINISQGPVVTLYELEPAAGTKSSRIIGLSDDIARSLSAISTRIAVIAGRNVLGIELPNKQREFFCLKELIETPEYQNTNIILPLILGKDLAGQPFVADLAKMPHLLVAGTTGSGKSVAINAMIISLLYRYTPEECRLIMIDPKMLELSAYEGIPHLLTPVVTEPSKAVIALKWAVKEMENRYRLMSNIGVRNIAGYNAKILEAVKEGKIIERTVQVGFDPKTGKPLYETVAMNMKKLPLIVVIVDEMADLMLVAGKDIELSIQRLAQMARAAGIHIIMATQRPSVDVITGVIKANFPSRISFKVTSKIDSRTILGEQGSEQLLGMGDMLYMGNASKITRIHGPFVDDREVENITEYLRQTGVPEYISAVTQVAEDDDTISTELAVDSGGTSDEALYKRAVQIVQLERKVSISYIQRCLRIGYNRAATLVEKMEQDGIISPPNHTGKREILLPE